jgi:hypothetical protein
LLPSLFFFVNSTKLTFCHIYASVAQQAEQLICNQWVGGSIPFAGFKMDTLGEVPERSKGADCKSAGSAFGGSNPPLSITERRAYIREDSGKAGIAQLARASAFQAEGRGFEPRFPLLFWIIYERVPT